MAERQTGTVTFLFTDIEGSTELLKRLGRERYGELLGRQKELVREAFAAYGGDEVDNQGDSFFAAFRGARDALPAAVAIQRSLADHEWPDGVDVLVRIGIHSGEAAAAADRYVGVSVHRAARIGAVAHGGQILVSESTRALVEDDLPDGLSLRDLGLWKLKDIDRPERVSQLVADGLRAEFPPLRGADPVKSARGRKALLAAAVVVVAAALAIPLALLGGSGGGSSSQEPVGADSVGTFDAASGDRVASTAVGAPPGAIAADQSSLWVANPDGGTVTRISAKMGLRQTITVGSDPSAVAVGSGFVWVANALSGTVSKIDPNAGGGSGAVVDTIPVGNGPAGIAFAHGRLWVANATDRTVMEFVPGAHAPLRTIGVPGGADALAAGFGFLWVASSTGNSVTRVALGAGVPLSPIDVGGGPIGIAVGDGAVWVANNLDGTVSRIDPGSGAVSGISVNGSPTGIAASRTSVWVSDAGSGTISRVDSGRIAATVRTGNQPRQLALSGSSLYVSVRASGFTHRGGALTVYADGTNFDTVDPATAFQASSWSVLSMTNDGLVTFQKVGGSEGSRLVPDLATSIPTPRDGGRTYTFQVREGVTYSDGTPVEPADFRRAIERSLTSGSFTGFFSSLAGASRCATKPHRKPKLCDLSKSIVVDSAARTVTFRLTSPDPDFLYELASPQGFAVPATTPLRAKLPLPATGPYRIASFDPKQGVDLVRNARFAEWSAAAQPPAYPDRVLLTFGVSAARQITDVEDGKGDYAAITPAAAATLARRGRANELHTNNTYFDTGYFFLGTRVAPFDDVRVRRAVNLAVERDRLVRLAGGAGSGTPTCQVLPPNVPGYVRYCPYPFDLSKARRLVAASGTAGTAITLWVSDRGLLPATEYLSSALAALGYRTRVKQSSYEAMVDPRNRVQVGSQSWIVPFPSASGFFSPLVTCPSFTPRAAGYNNPGLYCDPRVDRMIKKAQVLQTADPQAAGVLWSDIDRAVVQDAPWVSYSNPQQFDVVSRRVGNYEYNPVWGALLDQMWVR